MGVKIAVICLCIVLVELSVFLDRADGLPNGNRWPEWTTIGRGVKWLQNCDFPGYDIKFEHIPLEKCSKSCIDTSGCNAFRWFDGWCYLKNIPAWSLDRVPSLRGSCGFLPWEFSSTGFIS